MALILSGLISSGAAFGDANFYQPSFCQSYFFDESDFLTDRILSESNA